MIDVAGKFLIAPPRMADPRFHKAVVYIWKHDVTGSAGVIVNKPVDNPTFQEVCRQGNMPRAKGTNPRMYWGGPINDNLVGCLHSLDVRMSSTHISKPKSLGYTLDRTMVEHIAQGKERPNKWKLFLGMASWEPQQLEVELEALPPRPAGSSWLVLDFDPKLIWADLKENDMWEKCINLAVQQTTKTFTSKIFN
jgi:putative transcriptional regulator